MNNRLDASIAPQPLPAPEPQPVLTVHGRSADRALATGPPRFLFLDAEQRSTLAAVRAAARYGYRAAAAGSDRASLAHLSRACSDALVVPRPDTEPAAFVAALEEILDRDRYAGVITATEASLLALSEGRDRLAHLVPLGLPPHDVVVRCVDKVALAEAAAAVGAPTPTSIICESPAAGIDAMRRLGPPVVVKPATSLVRTGGDVWRQEGKFVSSEAELMRTHTRFGPRFIVQRLVSDAVLRSASGVVVDGRVRALTPVRYLRTWPPHAGSASLAETVAPLDGMPERIEALLNALGWEGLFEVEFLLAGPDVFMLDLNPRLHGWFTLALHAGADPLLPWCEWLLDGTVTDGRVVATPGVRYRWEEGELGTVLWNLRRGRLGTALSVARPRRGVVYAVSDVADPAPLAAWLLAFVRRAFRRLRR